MIVVEVLVTSKGWRVGGKWNHGRPEMFWFFEAGLRVHGCLNVLLVFYYYECLDILNGFMFEIPKEYKLEYFIPSSQAEDVWTTEGEVQI